jgi:signal transduction histidine kinase/CheY-like chemotaxis protein
MPGQVWATGTYQHFPTMTADHAFPRTNFASHFGRVSAIWVPIALDSQVVGVLEVFRPHHPQPDPELIGTLYGICGQIGQFVERKHLEHQFRQAQKMEAIGQLAGGVAHDFNNLLTIINGYSELIYGKLPVESPLRDLIAEVQKAGERATALTRQLLVFSRKQVLQPQIVGINRVIEGLTKILRRLIGEDVMLSFSPGADLAPVKVDPGYLEQTLINLAVNARDAMPDGGCLTLETRNVELDASYALEHHDVQPGRYVLVAVTDTGHGMEEGVRNRIFEPFFTTKEPGKGTGLGLSMVFGFVRQSGGHIQVYSEAGRGTTFKLYLPQSDKGGTPSLSSRLQTSTVGGNETILLVEDEERIRSVSAVILRAAGYTVLEAAHGLEALEVAQRYEGPIHLMVTDVVMPNMGGRPLANKMAETRPETKVLYVSGYTDDAIIRHGVLEEGIHFLHKPFSATALAVKVREVLDGSRFDPAAEKDVPTISP